MPASTFSEILPLPALLRKMRASRVNQKLKEEKEEMTAAVVAVWTEAGHKRKAEKEVTLRQTRHRLSCFMMAA